MKKEISQNQEQAFLKESPLGALQITLEEGCLVSINVYQDSEASSNTSLSLSMQSCLKQLQEYFLGKRKKFDLAMKFQGTEFQKKVWQALLEIPWGATRSYQDLANAIDHPQAVRAVGTANGANPIPIMVPCHRVIRKNGDLGGYNLGLERKSWLLKHEGQHV